MLYKLVLVLGFFMLSACTDFDAFLGENNQKGVSDDTGNCVDGNKNNQVNAGLGDPFYRHSWHLKNTGSGQTVSAAGTIADRNNANDDAIAGIDANVEAVHQNGRGCTGKGVTVAIVDSGLEISHEDLADNVVANGSFNFVNLSDNPSPSLNMTKIDHGTGVAGIVASRGWNSKGTRGVAPLAKLVAFPIVGVDGLSGRRVTVAALLAFGSTFLAKNANQSFGGTYSSMIEAFGQKADSVDVFNFSAGTDHASPDQGILGSKLSPFHEATKSATSYLRANKGAVVIQSAGNSFVRPIFNPSLICSKKRLELPELSFQNANKLTCGSSNHEPYGKPYAYQVSAIHNNGKASSYSSAGSDIWVTGFGGEGGVNEPAIITADNTGCSSGNNNINSAVYTQTSELMVSRMLADQKGENTNDTNCNYTGRMNGSSAAAPSVSGVVALMLEANPNLSQKDVGYILAKTARKVDEAVSLGNLQPTVKSGASILELDLPWQTNDAGFNFQNRYGFGLVDAKAAVKMAAKNYQAPAGRRVGNLVKETNVEADSKASGLFQEAKTQAVFADSTQKTGMMRVDLKLTNTSTSNLNAGRLQFELVNKTGKKSILMPAFTLWFTSADSLIKPNESMAFRFHTNAFYGENLGAYDIKVTFVGNQKFSIAAAKLTSFSI